MDSLTALNTDKHGWSERLLPGELQTPPATKRTLRDWIVDWTMFVVSLAVSATALYSEWPSLPLWGQIASAALAVIASASLFWRRSHPRLLLYTIIPLSAVTGSTCGPAAVVLFNTALRLPRRDLVIAFVINSIALITYPMIYEYEFATSSYLGDLLISFAASAVIIAWGLLTRSRRELLVSIRAQAASMEAERQLRDEQAKEAERRRIAREMHDVLAHRISLLSLHAGALEFRPDATPEEIAEAARVIRESARDALVELREVIGVLREPLPGDSPEPPQPTLGSLPLLVDDFRAAGLRIEFEPESLPPEPNSDVLSRTAYRVVQEGLVNASKHAANSTTRIDCDLDDDELCVRVINKLPVGAPAEHSNGAVALDTSGVGLVGLAERVELAGGSLWHGDNSDGEFVLAATLPWDQA